MANYTFSSDLITDILFRAGEPTDGTSDFDAVALQYLNRAYQGLWSGGRELWPEINEVWWWLRKDDQGVLTLNPLIDAGTVSVTNNSADITFGTAPAASQVGRHFKVDDHADIFIIAAHTAGAGAATLESVYTGDTDTAASFRSMQFDYTLASDILYLSGPLFAYQDGEREIRLIDLTELRRKYPINNTFSGVPKAAAMIAQEAIRFSHYGGLTATDFIKVDYEYTREPDDLTDSGTEEPLVPRQYRHILSDWALYLLFADKNDGRAKDAEGIARNGLLSMAKENRLRQARASASHFGHIFPRQGDIKRLEGPLRTESGLIIG